jgi:predicted O-methyltransferase YrrM
MKFLAVPLSALALSATLAHGADEPDRSGGPYVPTPPAVVEAMLRLAGVAERDFVVDLGSGDGRIVLTAATKFRAGGMGVEIDPELVGLASESARKLGVADRVRFVRQDVRQADLSKATVVTLYLLPGMMSNLRAKLLAELRPGARIVSHDFTFDAWRPDRTVTVDTPEKYDVTGAWTSDVHLWIVPARIQGVWQGRWLDRPGNGFRLDLRQGFQQFDGRIARRGHSAGVRDGRIRGADLSFTVTGGNGRPERFLATVDRGEMRGEVRDGETVLARWSATRVP